MHAPIQDFRTMQRACLVAGFVAFGISALMAWKFGSSISFAHGVALVVACFVASVIFAFRRFIVDQGVKGHWLTIAAVFFIALEFMSHLGYTFGMRDKQFVETGAQNVAYKAAQANMESHKTNLDLWRKQLEELKSQSPWAATIKADGLRAQLAVAQKEIDLEASRGGCKSKCALRMKDKADLEGRIATIEQADDLAKRIEATQRVVDKAVAEAKGTKVGHSTAKAQNDAFGELLRLISTASPDEAFEPDAKAKGMSERVADLIIGTMMAIGATGAPALLFYFAFFAAPGSVRVPAMPPASGSIPLPASHISTQAIANPSHVATAHATHAQPIEVSVPVTVRHEVQHEPAQHVATIPEPTLAYHPSNYRVARVQSSFARKVANITQRHQVAA
jgi:hypothetical protein